MAVKEIKDMGASVLTRLKKQAKETGIADCHPKRPSVPCSAVSV